MSIIKLLLMKEVWMFIGSAVQTAENELRMDMKRRKRLGKHGTKV